MENDGAAGGEELTPHLSAAELAGFTALPKGRWRSLSGGNRGGKRIVFSVFSCVLSLLNIVVIFVPCQCKTDRERQGQVQRTPKH